MDLHLLGHLPPEGPAAAGRWEAVQTKTPYAGTRLLATVIVIER
ncbi:hypothetical protein [Streptomyces sp. NPDC048639]